MPYDIKEMLELGKDLKVLFIEDNKQVRNQLIKLLKNFFYSIDECDNGDEALQMFSKHKKDTGKFYDLVITDISMPKQNGIQLSKKMIEINPKQIILVMSAHTESEKLMELIDIGIYRFIQKPINHTILFDSLSSAIKKIKNKL